MNLELLLLPLGIICLWAPSSLMASAKVKAKLRQGSRRSHEGLSALLRCKLNWIDLARSALGAWLIVRFSGSFRNLDSDIRWIPLAAQVTIFSVGCIAQILWFDRKVNIIGPLFYFGGFSLVVCGPLVGGFGLLMSINCALMFRRLGSCFVFAPACLLAFAVLFHKFGIIPIVNAGLFALPLVLAFATGSRLAFVRAPFPRRSKKIRRVVPAPKRVFDGNTYIPAAEMVGHENEASLDSTPPVTSGHTRDFKFAASPGRSHQ